MIKQSTYLDIRSRTINGYPIKIRIYDDRSKKNKLLHSKLYQKSLTLRMSPELASVVKEYERKIQICNENHLDWDESLKVLQDYYDSADDIEIAILEARLSKAKRRKYVDFRDFTLEFIQELEAKNMSTEAYYAVIREIDNYVGDKRFGINDMTYEWLNKYIIYKKRRGTKNGGLSYYLRSMRTVYRESQRRESLGVKQDNPFIGLIKNSVSPKTQQLQWGLEDLKKLIDFHHPTANKANQRNMRRVLDLFLFQFAVGGHDYVDIANMKWDDIKGDRIIFQRYKNRNKPNGGPWVNNKLFPFSLSIIKKYGDPDSDRIFSFIPEPGTTSYRNQNRLVGKSLERISKQLKIPKLMTKTPRYVFRTFAGDLLISDLIVETLQGHKPTSITHKYQKGISENVLDEEHLKILQLLL